LVLLQRNVVTEGSKSFQGEDANILECGAVFLVAYCMVFWRKSCNEAPWYTEMSGTVLPVTQNHIPEDLKHQQHCCGNLGATSFQFTVTGYRRF